MPFLIVVAILIVCVVVLLSQIVRGDNLLQSWAERNGFRIIDSQRRFFRRGPFFWTTGGGQTVFYVCVEDAAHNRRSGFVRCGDWGVGTFSGNVEVRWDDEC
jgi:hypothetical protein